jgi:hypothetical protein
MIPAFAAILLAVAAVLTLAAAPRSGDLVAAASAPATLR